MKKILSVVAMLLLTTGIAFGQATTGEIVGTIADTTGALVSGAKVEALNQNTGVSYPATATGTGEFRIVNLLAGPYTITVTAPGFATSVTKDFAVEVNKTATKDFKLSASSSSTVEVTSEASVALDTTTSQLQETYTAKEIADLPIAAANPLNVAFLAPGVTTTGGLAEGQGPSISGQRSRNNSFTVDGANNDNKTVTGPVVNVQSEAIGEFTLLENVFNAEYGHSNGGQLNVSLKSGTNTYHGEAYEYFQNRNLNAFDNASKLQGLTSQPRYDNNRFGGNFGGHIIKDKLFFFGDYEQNPVGQSGGSGSFCGPTAAGYTLLNTYRPGTNLKVLQQYLPAVAGGDPAGICNKYTYKDNLGVTHNYADSITVTQAGVPGDVGPNGDQLLIPIGAASAPAPSYSNGRYIAASADYVPTEKDNVRFRYAYYRNDGIDTAANLPIFFLPQPARDTIGSLTYVHDFTANLINEVRVAFNRSFSVTPSGSFTFPGATAAFTFPNIQLDDLGINLGPDGNAPQGGASNLFQLVDNVTYIHGHHAFKFGFDGRKYISYTDFVQRARGDYEYSQTGDLYLKDLSPDVLGQRNASGAVSTRYYGDQTEFYGFGQDDWRVTPKLTLNYGLRYEFSSIPAGEKLQYLDAAASVPGVLVFSKPMPARKDFAPRVGFAYAADERTSIRAGFAIGYDVLYDNIGSTEAPPQQQVTENVNLANPTPNFLAQGGLAAQAPSVYPTLAAQRAASTHYLPDQFKMPYTESWSLGIQHVFHNDYTAEVRYVGNHAVHLDTQQQMNVQPVVTPTNNIPVFIGGGGATGTLTLKTLTNQEAAGGNIIPAYYNAGGAGQGFVNAITGYLFTGQSNYNGLQTQLTRRFKRGLLFNVDYTWSKTMDNSTDDFNSTALNPRRAQDQTNYNAEYSLSALSHKHRFTAEIIYDVPFFKNSGFVLHNLVGNWEIAPIYTYESGQFVTPQSGIDSNLNGDSAGDRAIINPNGNKNIGSGTTPVYNPALAGNCTPPATTCTANLVAYTVTNPNAYYITTPSGALATAGRSMLPTPAINDFTLSAIKRISYHERYQFEFEAIAFNVINHPEFTTGPVNATGGSGATTGTAYQKYAIPSQTAFLNPRAVFGSNARSMILVAKLRF